MSLLIVLVIGWVVNYLGGKYMYNIGGKGGILDGNQLGLYLFGVIMIDEKLEYISYLLSMVTTLETYTIV